jgi:hypothetical protein
MGWLGMINKLWYDEECPICRTFKNELQSRTNGEIEFIVCDPEVKSFKYENSSGVYEGAVAINALVSDFPDLVPALNVLPEEWKKIVFKSIATFASIGRQMYKTTARIIQPKKPCNCGK